MVTMGCCCKGRSVTQRKVSNQSATKEVSNVKPNYYGLFAILRDWLTNSIIYADRVGIKNRLGACNSCSRLSRIRTCKECGCFVDLKVKYYQSTCPKGMW